MKIFTIILCLCFIFHSKGEAQSYAPAVGFEGSTAIHKDSSIFIDWAIQAEVFPSYQNIAFPENGLVNYGSSVNATGKAGGNPGVISLGDGGTAVLQFNNPIVNGEGFDFAVFENGFFENDTSELAFLELAFVDVSTDGIEYIRFPSATEIQNHIQIISFENINARYIHNFAGKYRMFFGTPFDLDDIADLTSGTSINVNDIKFIKITDVVGSIDDDFANYDSQGNKVNDPHPTPFPSGGFDLDAVGVINNTQNNSLNKILEINPNPVSDVLKYKSNIINPDKIEIYNSKGILILETTDQYNINVGKFKTGIYFLIIQKGTKFYSAKFLKI